jgi:UDP-N-acetylmuramoylalanine--D-glutamate ligase
VPVVSEIDLFLRLCPSLTVGVTGTKGKTTTSALCAAILATAPQPVLLGGNIGVPLVERLPELTHAHRVVLELSELQLPTLSRGTRICVYTHVTADHLDRHGDLAAYRAVKRRLAELTPPDGVVVINDEDPVSREFVAATRARVVRYRRADPPPGGIGVVDGWLVADGRGRVLPLSEIPLPGLHSVSNVAAACAVGLELRIAPDAIRDAVVQFAGVEHRLETVALHDGVRYVNDSMGTQPDAVIAALRSFEPPLVLIAGGRAKDLVLDELARVVAERVAAAVLIGESGPDLGRWFGQAGLTRTSRARDMEDAVAQADSIARELRARSPEHQTATVLLSPAAASFDMYRDYAARGQAFRDAVAVVVGQRGAAR